MSTKTVERKRFYAPTGTHYIKTYTEVIKNGIKTLEHTGETDVYERMQEEAEGTKIEKILQRAAMGDLEALQQREAVYIDTTNMPKTMMEAQNMVLKLKQEFETLPLEVRKLFDNSAEKYVEEMGSDVFNTKMAPYNEKIKAIQEAGSLKAYQKKVADEAKFQKDVETAKGAVANE